jgi:hypothetical protein
MTKKTEMNDEGDSNLFSELREIIEELPEEFTFRFKKENPNKGSKSDLYIQLYYMIKEGRGYIEVNENFANSKNIRDHIGHLTEVIIEKYQPVSEKLRLLQKIENAFELRFNRMAKRYIKQLNTELTQDDYWIRWRLLELIYLHLDIETISELDNQQLYDYRIIGQFFKDYNDPELDGETKLNAQDFISQLFKYRKECLSISEELIQIQTKLKNLKGSSSSFNMENGFTYDHLVLGKFFKESFDALAFLFDNKSNIPNGQRHIIGAIIHDINERWQAYRFQSKHLIPTVYTIYLDTVFQQIQELLLVNDLNVNLTNSLDQVNSENLSIRISVRDILFRIVMAEPNDHNLKIVLKSINKDISDLLNKKKKYEIDKIARGALMVAYIYIARLLKKSGVSESGTSANFKKELKENEDYHLFLPFLTQDKIDKRPDVMPVLVFDACRKLHEWVISHSK